MTDRNSPHQPMPPQVTAQSSLESKEVAKTFLLVFRRYLAESDEYQGMKQVPPLFVEGLLDHVLEHNIKLDLDDSFHLRLGTRCDSTATKAVFSFSIDQGMLQRKWRGEEHATIATKTGGGGEGNLSLIGFRVTRKWDSDTQIMDLHTGDTKSEGGHYMSSSEERIKFLKHKDIIPPGEHHTAKDILHEHWIAPHRWWNIYGDYGKKATLVRPSSLLESATPERFCSAARKALSGGYTLFLANSLDDLVQLELPGRSSKVKVAIAGLMWQEGVVCDGAVERNSSDDGENFNPSRSDCNLKFIIPERSLRRGNGILDFQDGMIVWNEWDEYKYVSHWEL